MGTLSNLSSLPLALCTSRITPLHAVLCNLVQSSSLFLLLSPSSSCHSFYQFFFLYTKQRASIRGQSYVMVIRWILGFQESNFHSQHCCSHIDSSTLYGKSGRLSVQRTNWRCSFPQLSSCYSPPGFPSPGDHFQFPTFRSNGPIPQKQSMVGTPTRIPAIAVSLVG